MSWIDDLQPKPPSRRYPFWARRDRRRTAQALGGGRSPEQVAMVQRVATREVELLLRDAEFAELVRHYRALIDLPPETRLAQLAAKAMGMLELAVECGELRVCMFVLRETRAGRDPAETLARRVVTRIEAEAARAEPRPLRRKAASPAEPREKPSEWDHCAAVSAGADDAEAMAVSDLRAVAAGVRRTLDALADRLMGEAERAGTALLEAPVSRLERTARGVARHYQDRPFESLKAAERLDDLRRAARQGRHIGRSAGGPDPPG